MSSNNLNATFYFKKFSIEQSQCAMKVGTDGVLLGAMVKANLPQTMLDIGTGTGLLGLMMAQKYESLKNIIAVEIDTNAASQASQNFANSSWSKKMQVYHSAIQDYTQSTNQKFDLILCNPPYFEINTRNKISKRSNAREQHSLSYEILIKSVDKVLEKDGDFYLIIPWRHKQDVILHAKMNDLFLRTNITVYSKISKEPKRSIMSFSKIHKEVINSEIIIHPESNTRKYTQEYINLTKDFYLDLK